MPTYQGTLNSQNEDYDYHDLGQRITPGEATPWGCLIHPDELRKVIFVGNGMLVTVNGQQIQDYQLKNWLDHNVRVLGGRLEHDIYPRLFRHHAVHAADRRTVEPYAEREDVYLKSGQSGRSFRLKLRHHPVVHVHKWELRSVHDGQLLIDLLPYAIIDRATGLLSAPVFNVHGRGPAAMPIAAYRIGTQEMQYVHCVDYSTGYEHASQVPRELVEVVINRMTIDVMSAYGDGIVGGLANSSVSVGVLSESIGTTMSATSAYFGARIAEKQKWEADWFKQRAGYYKGIKLGVL